MSFCEFITNLPFWLGSFLLFLYRLKWFFGFLAGFGISFAKLGEMKISTIIGIITAILTHFLLFYLVGLCTANPLPNFELAQSGLTILTNQTIP